MTKERLEEILNNIIGWAYDHDDEFIQSVVDAMDINSEEAVELELEDWVQCPEDESDDDDEIKELKYLLNKENCCQLDHDELYRLEELLDKHGRPNY